MEINNLTVGQLVELCKTNGLNPDKVSIMFVDREASDVATVLTSAEANKDIIEVF